MDLKKLSNVAAAAEKIMAEGLKGNQHKIDKNKNNKIDAHDFAILRGEKKAVKKEEVEQVEEASTYKLGRAAAETKDFPIHHNGEHVGTLEFHTSAGKLHHRVASVKGVPHEKFIGHPDREKMTNAHVAKHEVEARKHFAKKIKEDIDQAAATILEYESKDGKYVHKGTYGYQGKGAEHGNTDYEKANDDEKKESKSNRRKYGARQNYVRSSRVNETFSGLLNTYKEGGLKALSESLIKEEPTQDEFNAELEKQKAKQAGTAKQAEVAKPAVAAVQNEETHTQVEVIDFNDVNGVKHSVIDLEERSMTEPEMKKREEIVKSMKKGMAGFKERYGDRAKNVMYATATKQAMKEQKEDHWQKGYDHVRDPIADEPYLDNARHRFNELKKNNPHKKGTQEHKDWHAGAHTAYEEHKDMLKGN